MPPTAQVDKKRIVGYPLPAVIFPKFAKCKRCNRIHHAPWHGVDKEITKDLLCHNCSKPSLEQVTWCAVSSEGNLTDVPWHYICHLESQKECKEDIYAAYLEITSGQRG